ncbi:hypothetical protein F6X68_04700 [Micromonospora sp. AMSO12t]|uniref:hypothetical protein n=1 Tax=unclassified Micromonospora TaxID=2617518 RepID=UPI00124BA9B1|nr:hypothetical protein [Micromonospora sp. AMSO12t]KAB1161412.1 hypothetical protein F6X68_04700 [Micromonospora sp. AMSO12t]
MSILDAYEIYDPGVSGLWKNLSRGEAARAVRRLLADRPRRLQELRRLAERAEIELPEPQDATDGQLQGLSQWFFANLERDGRSSARLAPAWYSVVSDMGLYVGEVIIARGSGLEWRMFTGDRRSDSYQELVVMGFPVANKNYYVNPGFVLADLASAHLSGAFVSEDPIVDMVRHAVATSHSEDD